MLYVFCSEITSLAKDKIYTHINLEETTIHQVTIFIVLVLYANEWHVIDFLVTFVRALFCCPCFLFIIANFLKYRHCNTEMIPFQHSVTILKDVICACGLIHSIKSWRNYPSQVTFSRSLLSLLGVPYIWSMLKLMGYIIVWENSFFSPVSCHKLKIVL